MVTKRDDPELDELRHLLRRVLRGLWGRRPVPPSFVSPEGPRLTRRHAGVLAQLANEGARTVGELATELGISLPAASKLSSELEARSLVERREDPADRRRRLVDLDARTSADVRQWLEARNRPLGQALASLTAAERAGFLKGLRALAEALMEESPDGSFRSHHRPPHRRRPHRHRPL